MKIYNLDLHIGVYDVHCILKTLGHELICDSLSDHHYIMGWERAKNDIVGQHNWKMLDKKMCDSFYERYKNELNQYDAFYTFYPPAFAMLYERFNKPIIVHIPLRYEIPFFNDSTKWNYFNDFLKRGIDNKQIIPLVNNKYDQKYLELFTERQWSLIPSLCEYTSPYTGNNNNFLYCSKYEDVLSWLQISQIVSKSLTKGHTWQQLADYKATIHIPYSNTIMTLFEQYASNMPLLFPSEDFLFQLWKQNDNEVMSEISWNKIFNLINKSLIKVNNLKDPNDYKNEESFKYWVSLSDFYNQEWMPHIEYFNSLVELKYKLFTLDFHDISDKMKVFNIVRKERILNKWQKILEEIY
jgi:hypothetical protein